MPREPIIGVFVTGFQYRTAIKNFSALGGDAVSHPYWRAVLKTGIPAHTNREKLEKNRENDKSDYL